MSGAQGKEGGGSGRNTSKWGLRWQEEEGEPHGQLGSSEERGGSRGGKAGQEAVARNPLQLGTSDASPHDDNQQHQCQQQKQQEKDEQEGGDGGGDDVFGPTNFAYHSACGYQGLLLHSLSPAVAEVVYPIIATMKFDSFMTVLFTVLFLVATLPLLVPSLPVTWTHILAFAYVPVLHRLLLLDMRIVRLLLGMFDCMYLIGTSRSRSPMRHLHT